jgi:hypothetical protein
MRDIGTARRAGPGADDDHSEVEPGGPGHRELLEALDAIERLNLRIRSGGPELQPCRAQHFAAALSMIDAALGEAMRSLHRNAASEAD